MKDTEYITDLLICAAVVCFVITFPALVVWLSQ